jgi:HEAT repeat protein
VDGKALHWHVDYLREHAAWGGAWVHLSDKRLECDWALALRHLPGARAPVPGFGTSDCRCPTHLIQVQTLPKDDWMISALDAERTVLGAVELDELLEVLASGDEESRESAARALGGFGTSAIEPLAAMLGSLDVDARWWAARALAEVASDGSLPPLIGALTDADPDVRACAALALGRIRDGTAAPALAALLADESAFVASVAADALSMIGEEAIEALVETLTAENPHTRLLAVRALGRMKSQNTISPLFGMLEDSSYLVRYYAHEALEALGVGMVFVAP